MFHNVFNKNDTISLFKGVKLKRYTFIQSDTITMENENMNYNFELNTTLDKHFRIVANMNITMEQLYEQMIREIEYNTVFTRDDILDIFIQDNSGQTLSIPKSTQSIKDFVPMNRQYFPNNSIPKNTYKLYAIDRMYGERLKSPSAQKERHREINTDPIGGFIQQIKKRISFW